MTIHLTPSAAMNDAIEFVLLEAVRGGAGDDWEAPCAAKARALTDRAGWSWDFTTWADALDDFRVLRCAAAGGL